MSQFHDQVNYASFLMDGVWLSVPTKNVFADVKTCSGLRQTSILQYHRRFYNLRSVRAHYILYLFGFGCLFFPRDAFRVNVVKVSICSKCSKFNVDIYSAKFQIAIRSEERTWRHTMSL